MKNFIKYLNVFIKILLFSLLLFIFVNRLINLIYDYKYQYPREYRDGAIIDIANEFKNHHNPFLINNTLPHSYAYGFVPPLIVGTIGQLSKSSLTQTQLSLSLLLTLLTITLVGYSIWKTSKNILITLTGIVATSIFMNVSFRPEIYAIFITILILVISSSSKPRNRDIILFGAISILLYYIKPYFILLSAVLFFHYIQLNKPLSNGIKFLTSTILSIIISISIINKLFPMYFLETFINNLNLYNTHQFSWMTKQFLDFFINNWSISIAFLILSLYSLVSKKKETLRNTFFIYIVISVICLILSLGQHIGTYMTYYYQLLPIPMVMFIVWAISNLRPDLLKSLIKYGFIFSVIINYKQVLKKPINFYETKSWTEAVNYIKQNNPNNSFLSPHFVTVAIDNSWPIYDNGQTEFFTANEIWEPKQKFLIPLFPLSKEVSIMFSNYKKEINNKISNKEFSLVVLPKDYYQLINYKNLQLNYTITKIITIPTNLEVIEFWKPI